jgi:hypothetical protein
MPTDLITRLRAANPVPPTFDHLNDPDLLQRLSSTDVVIGDDGEDSPRRRQRKPSLTSIIRQAAKAGVEIAGYEVRPDGTIKIVTGKPVGDIELDDSASSDPKWN